MSTTIVRLALILLSLIAYVTNAQQPPAGPMMLRPGEKPSVRQLDFAPMDLPVHLGYVTAVRDGVVIIRAERTKEITAYPLHDRLASGQLQRHASAAFGYLPADLEIGDHVQLGVLVEGKTVWCVQINILKRPGGRVPESRLEKRDVRGRFTYAERQNAENDWRDYEIPYPPHILNRVDEQMRLVESALEAKRLFDEYQAKEDAMKKEAELLRNKK